MRADEVTYDLHILVRFRLERALIAGDLLPADLPAAWNEVHRRLLGVSPADDAEGCLQDGHWAAGLFGYFPTYTLGNVIAAQLFARAEADLGGMDDAFAARRFLRTAGVAARPLLLPRRPLPDRRGWWKRRPVPPDPKFLIASLREKYEELYGVA